MREEIVKRDAYWVVEATARDGRVLFFAEFRDFESAWEKYTSFKGKATAMLQRRFREYKIA